ncbi:MAG: ABC transporter permease [Planctomycetota bacterium]|jgi:ABC-type transport system involved in multi-copper enzyme maturation permease subunit
MGEIFRIQLGQILGGRMKWLVLLCLSLPVLLTLGAVSAGGIGEIQREVNGEIAWQSALRGIVPETSEEVLWEGEDRSYVDGRLELREDGVYWNDQALDNRRVIVVDHGRIIVTDGELWVDPTIPARARSRSIISSNRRRGLDLEPESIQVSMELVYSIYLFLLYPQTICLLLALFYGTSVLGQELDGKTLTYLFTRPLPRWKFVLGKYLGILAALAVPLTLSVLGSWLLLGAVGGLKLIGSILLVSLGAVVAYNAIFLLFGFLIPRRAMIAALLYGVFFEFVLSFVPAMVNQITVTYYLRSIVTEIMQVEVPKEISRIVGGSSVGFSLFSLLIIVVASLVLASLLAARKEFVIKDDA